MKTILSLLFVAYIFSACSQTTVPMVVKSENFHYKQAKAIIETQKKARKNQLKAAQKMRKKELNELRAYTKK